MHRPLTTLILLLIAGTATLPRQFIPLATRSPVQAGAVHLLEGVTSDDIRYDAGAYRRLLNLRQNRPPTVFSMGHCWQRDGVWQGFHHAKRILDQFVGYGARTIMHTWMPGNCAMQGGGFRDPPIRVADITAGHFVGELVAYAQSMARWHLQHPDIRLVIRFAHEADGNWFPWSDGVKGNAKGDFVAMWRTVRMILAMHAPRAEVVWSVTQYAFDAWPHRPLQHYPGAQWVDLVGMTDYLHKPGWIDRTAAQSVRLAEQRLSVFGKPLWLTELGVYEVPHAPTIKGRTVKEDDLEMLFKAILPSSRFQAVVYYPAHRTTPPDGAYLQSSPDAVRGYRRGLRALYSGLWEPEHTGGDR